MLNKIMNKLYPGKENYKKRNAIYRRVKEITEGIKCLASCSLASIGFIGFIVVIAIAIDC